MLDDFSRYIIAWKLCILLGHNKIENTVRYLGIDVEDALAFAENTEI